MQGKQGTHFHKGHCQGEQWWWMCEWIFTLWGRERGLNLHKPNWQREYMISWWETSMKWTTNNKRHQNRKVWPRQQRHTMTDSWTKCMRAKTPAAKKNKDACFRCWTLYIWNSIEEKVILRKTCAHKKKYPCYKDVKFDKWLKQLSVSWDFHQNLMLTSLLPHLRHSCLLFSSHLPPLLSLQLTSTLPPLLLSCWPLRWMQTDLCLSTCARIRVCARSRLHVYWHFWWQYCSPSQWLVCLYGLFAFIW